MQQPGYPYPPPHQPPRRQKKSGGGFMLIVVLGCCVGLLAIVSVVMSSIGRPKREAEEQEAEATRAAAKNAATMKVIESVAEMSGELDPPLPRVGKPFVVRIKLTNRTPRPLDGFKLTVRHDQDQLSLLRVVGGAESGSSSGSTSVRCTIGVEVNETQTCAMVFQPLRSGQSELSVVAADLYDPSGSPVGVTTRVAVSGS